ncbi:MAG: response regulator [Myxococcales bacterium]|nr:response regulator [Myxococcales bacterium]
MSKTLLVVDDSRFSRTTIRMFVQDQRPDWRILEAPSAEAAMEVAGAEEVDLFSVDFNMPGADGLTFAKAMRAIRPDAPIVLLTANVQASIQEASDALGVHCVHKPVTQASIQKMLEHFSC